MKPYLIKNCKTLTERTHSRPSAILSRAKSDDCSLDGCFLDGCPLDGFSLDGYLLDGYSLDGSFLDGFFLDGCSLVAWSFCRLLASEFMTFGKFKIDLTAKLPLEKLDVWATFWTI